MCNSYLTNENLPWESNKTRFGEMILSHIKVFKIHKNNHNIKLFLLKAHYVKKTASDQPFDCSMDFFKILEMWLRQSTGQLVVWICA